ncbi:hypothetical protein FRX31_025948 [Thalictrum thalictroides]|uniref:Uncharacterized protein n=1 Tax=Thalictrum thalictroides TaxID=46969 RepID=A0A7J6VJU7_THATH|nr:hypothetical protein FRX31_025948 [Thalictrum thalictroides]
MAGKGMRNIRPIKDPEPSNPLSSQTVSDNNSPLDDTRSNPPTSSSLIVKLYVIDKFDPLSIVYRPHLGIFRKAKRNGDRILSRYDLGNYSFPVCCHKLCSKPDPPIKKEKIFANEALPTKKKKVSSTIEAFFYQSHSKNISKKIEIVVEEICSSSENVEPSISVSSSRSYKNETVSSSVSQDTLNSGDCEALSCEELPSNREDSSANNTINTILTPEPYVAEFSMGEKTVTVEDSAFTDSKVAFIMLSKSILPLDETNVIGMTDGEVRRAYYKALIQTKDLGAEVVGRSETLVAKIKELKTENLHLKDQL